MKRPRDHRIYGAKRAADIVCAIVALIITLPISIVALIGIKMTQLLRGNFSAPFFYHEIRMSHGEKFLLYKFNIFKHEKIRAARENGTFIHTKEFEKHNGITWIGWVLKQIYMDELPQLYNVLVGDMSIVGPRPVNLEVYQGLMQRNVTAKREVRAGITGNYQSYKNTEHKSSDKMDREYVDYYKSHSGMQVLLFDLRIMLRTTKVILRAKGV